jgi:hypothetical protein
MIFPFSAREITIPALRGDESSKWNLPLLVVFHPAGSRVCVCAVGAASQRESGYILGASNLSAR